VTPKPIFVRSAVGFLAFCCLTTLSSSQQFTSFERDQVQIMLRDVASDIKKRYYDPNFHGVDWDAKVRETKGAIDKANSMTMALADVAAALDSLRDSHTFFEPPGRYYLYDYGFKMQMIGDHCYITLVRPGTDAQIKGLKPGDEVTKVVDILPTRDNFPKLLYILYVLWPQQELRLSLRGPDDADRQVAIAAKTRELPHVIDQAAIGIMGPGIYDTIRERDNRERSRQVRYAERGDELLIVKLPLFALTPTEVDSMVEKMRKHRAVVLDVRGNPGGSVETLQSLLGGIFETDVKIGNRVGRSPTKPLAANSRHNGFKGKLIVLVDSQSSSASELLARVIQIEKRGLVVGDRSSGRVMESQHYNYRVGMGTVILYGASITEADIKMTDGQSLERRGVNPDTLILPTASDLANGRDPVLAHAAEMLNVKISPEESGSLFPYVWPKE